MKAVRDSISSSFARLKEVLGFGDEQKQRSIPLKGEGLFEAREQCKDNVVITSKYNVFSFLPVNLFQQMSKAANIYFLVITILQTVKVISISNGEPTMLPPLILVILTSMIKDAYEDYCRHVEDAAENNSRCSIFNRLRNSWEDSRWGDVKVGDFIMVK